jgi:hypothetical protein
MTERAAVSKRDFGMIRSARLLLLCLAVAACSRHQGNIISTANNEGFAPIDNGAAANAAASAGNGGAGNVAAGNGAADNMAGNGQAPAASHDQVLRSETVSGIFTGWEMGDYLWGHIQVAGREPISAQPGPAPIDLFLDANRGRPVTVEVATVRTEIPEAGMTEIQRITSARNATTTAEAWWQGLSAADRAAAQRRFEAGPLSGGE